MMTAHAATAVRAYLKAAGLPDFDPKAWSEARATLLGDAAKDRNNMLVLEVDTSAASRSLADAAIKLRGG